MPEFLANHYTADYELGRVAVRRYCHATSERALGSPIQSAPLPSCKMRPIGRVPGAFAREEGDIPASGHFSRRKASKCAKIAGIHQSSQRSVSEWLMNKNLSIFAH